MNKSFKYLAVLVATAACCAVSCQEEEPVKGPVKVTGVTLNETKITVDEGEEFTLVATVSPADADDPSVSWTSSDPSVVSISEQGKAKALKGGTATVMVLTNDGGKAASCIVTVNALIVAVQSVAVEPSEITISINESGPESAELSATVLPENASDKTVVWTSDKPEIATVDENGKVTAVSAGTAEISAACGDKAGTCTVKVEYNFSFIGKFAITGTRIYGGTGADYGGAALTDPTKKSVWSANGCGPEAYNDDYLELSILGVSDGRPYGKCIHYGGADGKEWNCTYPAAYNNVDPGYNKDLHEFFNQIPAGETTWAYSIEDKAIAFVDKDNKMTYAQFMSEGSYPFKNDKNNTALTIEEGKYAFAFATKGKDDWDAMYTNYDMLAGNPRYFFYLVDKVDEIPSESKTTGVETPEAAQPVISPANAIGKWAVTNMWVVGGAVDRYTMDKVEDKTWCWNNYSCNKEKNNILTIKADGTANYDGLENGYWDYMYAGNKAGVKVDPMIDCSKWYGQIPHGDFTYTFDPATGEAVFGTGDDARKAKLMAPGSYPFWGILKSGTSELKQLVIAENQMGVRFVLAKRPSADVSYAWTDYDRFVNSPLVYIMVFTKQ